MISGSLSQDLDIILPIIGTLGFCIVAVLGHLGYRYRPALWLYHGILGLIVVGCYGMAALVGLSFVMYKLQPEKFALPMEQMVSMFYFGPGVFITGIMGTLVLIPPTRRWLYQWFPGDTNAILHRFALICTLFILSMQIFMLRTLTPEMIRAMLKDVNFFLSTCIMQVVLLVLTLCGGGLGITRNWKELMERLGVRKLSWKGVGLAILGALVLFYAVTGVEIYILGHFSPDSAELGEEMARLVQLHQPLWIAVPVFLALSLLVGAGEELFFRGLLQPAVGMFLSSLLFAFIHTQYGFTPVILILFLVSLLFGWVRNRYGVVAGILLHGFYDFFNFIHIQV